MKVRKIIETLDRWYPQELASLEDQGKIGLQLGDADTIVTGILLTLDLTLAVVEEAILHNLNVIVSHHPFIYHPLKKIDYSSPMGMILSKMVKHNISLFAMHTNLDVGMDGVNDTLAKRIGLENYQLLPEEIAQDKFLRFGNIKSVTLEEFAKHVKNALALDGVRVVGDLKQKVEVAGVVGGSGGQYEIIDEAISKRLDVYVTGEISLHIAQYAFTHNLALIEVTHGVEKHVFDSLASKLQTEFPHLPCRITQHNTDPFVFIG